MLMGFFFNLMKDKSYGQILRVQVKSNMDEEKREESNADGFFF